MIIPVIIMLLIAGISTFNVKAQSRSEDLDIIYGIIIDAETNETIEGAVITVYNDEQNIIGTNISNVHGEYFIENITGGNFTITVKMDQYYESSEPTTLPYPRFKNQSRFDFKLTPIDTDGDGYPDKWDYFPNDPDKWEEPISPGPDGDDDISEPEKEESKSSSLDEFEASSILCIAIFVVIIIIIAVVALMYTRLKAKHMLDHKTRELLYAYIQNHPGVHYRGIMKELDLKMGVLTHHLNMLEKQNYIKSLQDGPYRRFYIKDQKVTSDLLLTEPQQMIIETIKTNPGMSQSQIASNLNMTKKTVYYNVNQLRDAGLVFVDKEGRESECFYAGET